MPKFLADAGGSTRPHWAFIGDSGCGKSSLVNYLLDEQVAEVGTRRTTLEPTGFGIHGFAVNVWDCPGLDAGDFSSCETYVQNMGLRHLSFVMIVSAGRWTERTLEIIARAKTCGVPYRVVRTKVDLDLKNELEDNDTPPEDTLTILREEAKEVGISDVYFVTAKRGEYSKNINYYDNHRLLEDVRQMMFSVRDAPSAAVQPRAKVTLEQPDDASSSPLVAGEKIRSSQGAARGKDEGSFEAPNAFWRSAPLDSARGRWKAGVPFGFFRRHCATLPCTSVPQLSHHQLLRTRHWVPSCSRHVSTTVRLLRCL